ncbi:chaperone required for the assembly of F1-ATPase [Hoeflea sp. IMCC20628]|uniref:ATP12 family chaperone protein n=1 Tax=Hoeflea sp. IMCC20628 TaxID=1620421 RepID=UPI00063A9785|nr:ATP12 family protein [Hoeflea sp. IMCC20628]AKI00895.1 chaperone required for the assembly of F1-ATPase [Hoeflea sp. IMCC20628]
MSDILSDLDLGDAKPSDPVREAQAGLKKVLPKRFYKQANVIPGAEGGFVVALDGKPVRTPSRQELGVAYADLAAALAAEWEAQTDKIDPATMPLTRMINTAIDAVSTAEEEVFEDILRYAGSDLLCYRADGPEALVAREAKHWDPHLDWAASMGARLVLAEGIIHVEQPADAIRAIAVLLRRYATPLELTALHTITTITGSLVLALALAEGRAEPSEIWDAAHVDEDFNIAQWGEDYEAAARRATRLIDFQAAAQILSACKA